MLKIGLYQIFLRILAEHITLIAMFTMDKLLKFS